jgi:N-acetyl sugar amidotransferase
MKYCTRCLYPDSKPDLTFNKEGVCSACTAFDAREDIDWARRQKDFQKIVDDAKKEKKQYDCIVPVSGGKDSHYQTLMALQYGLKPLAVTATTDHISDIGHRNLDNISQLGVDHVHVTCNGKIRKKLNAFSLREIGDISWAEHATIFSIPFRVASWFDVPLVIYGENPQNEYGGPSEEKQKATKIDQKWLEEFGGLNSLRVSDIVDQKLFTQQEMELYTYPKTNAKGVFLGQFFPWDGAKNAEIACHNGFRTAYGPVEGTGYDYENLDNLQTGIHDYFKYLKFGFGRCTDIASNHIRRQNITRREAKEIVELYDGRYPSTYLGVPLQDILDRIEVEIEEFLELAHHWANKDLFDCRDKKRPPRPLFKRDLRSA